ncbi:Transferase domain-containing protein [Cephalotus follicularis]|uniref:Transferase domain-containing protein n=1 Tax=Cephalotus follicularis TaxID=3775 RepID=A0A1Q3B0K9_CEPFO|nr:Transferase domain-containing protein [Cephalotus follicularis]
MRVKTIETSLILPSASPFSHDHALPLSHLDNDRNIHVTFRYLRAYVGTTTTFDHHPFQVIASALSSSLIHYYPLAATLRHRHVDDRLELHCTSGQGVPLTHSKVDCTLKSVNHLDNPEPDFVEQLVPEPDPEEGRANPCILQVTVFKCGGFTLGAAIHHALCDGLGATQFFNAVAELARGASKVSVEPVWERASFLAPSDPTRVDGPVREYLSLEKGYKRYGEVVGPIVRECFHVKDECLEQLKRVIFDKCGLRFTTFEALGAFIWRAKVKASGIPGDETMKFAYSVNIRKIVEPPLPAGYWGNGCITMYVQLTVKELIEQPIWRTAELIKKSKSNATDEYVRSFIDFQELHYGDAITTGKGVSGFTDWRHLGHSTVDFGWGGPVTVLPLSKNLLGSVEPCFFLPYSQMWITKMGSRFW